MLREARKAGLPLDEEKVRASDLFIPEAPSDSAKDTPFLQVDGLPVSTSADIEKLEDEIVSFKEAVHQRATTSIVHDSLEFGGGLSWKSVLAWRFMEHIPFRRMDLQKDGKKSISEWSMATLTSDRLMEGNLLAFAPRRDPRYGAELQDPRLCYQEVKPRPYLSSRQLNCRRWRERCPQSA